MPRRHTSFLPSGEPPIGSYVSSSFRGLGCVTGRRQLRPRATNQTDIGVQLGDAFELHLLIVGDSIHHLSQGSDQFF